MYLLKILSLTRIIAAIVTVLLTCSDSSDAAALMGCEDREQVVNLVKTLTTVDWRWNRNRIRGIWPQALVEKDLQREGLDPQRGWTMLSHRGRFTDWCECCETFEFHLKWEHDETVTEKLSRVTIFYSGTDRDQISELAQSLLLIIVPSKKHAILSDEWIPKNKTNSRFQIFRQESGEDGAQTDSGADVEISQKGNVWTLYLSFYLGG